MKDGHRSTESNGLISAKTTDRLNTLTKITDKSSCWVKTDQRTKTTEERDKRLNRVKQSKEAKALKRTLWAKGGLKTKNDKGN